MKIVIDIPQGLKIDFENENWTALTCAEMKNALMHGKLLTKEPCEDCISREAVNTLVDELARAISDERCCMSRGRSTATIMQDILDLPSVTPQPYWTESEEKMKTPKTEISYDSICDRMPDPQTHYSTYELAERWAKEKSLAFNEPVYIVKRTTTYEICNVIGKKKEAKDDSDN